MNDSKDFQDVESVRSGHSHVTSRPVSFPLHPRFEGMLRHSFVSPSLREGPPSIWDTHCKSGNFLINPDASSSAVNLCISFHPVLGGMLSRSFVPPSRKHGSVNILDTHGISGNVFANPTVFFSTVKTTRPGTTTCPTTPVPTLTNVRVGPLEISPLRSRDGATQLGPGHSC